MPLAISNAADTVHRDLKTLEGGFVEARRLTYGEKLQRRAMVSGMKFQSQRGKKDFEGEMQLVNEQATIFDFKNCITNHNLEKPGPDGEPVMMDLTNVADIRLLDPRVGEEIDSFLGELNNFDEDDEGN
jgi:hypothetical protein